MADAIATPNDEYMNSLFTTWTATTGPVALGANAPIGLSACVDSTTGQLTNFNSSGLTGAGVILDKENVPKADRFALISPVTATASDKNAPPATGEIRAKRSALGTFSLSKITPAPVSPLLLKLV
ncbi:MAG: hypothetical protein ACKPEQ_37970, partial [Dolichospermum sp.]